jgi:hypothetical protein
MAVGLEFSNIDRCRPALFRIADDEVANLLGDCGLAAKADPIAAVFAQMEEALSLEQLIAGFARQPDS